MKNDYINYKGYNIAFNGKYYTCKGNNYNSLKFIKDLIDFKMIQENEKMVKKIIDFIQWSIIAGIIFFVMWLILYGLAFLEWIL